MSSATHRGQYVEKRHVVRHDSDHVNDVLEVAPELELLGRSSSTVHTIAVPGSSQMTSTRTCWSTLLQYLPTNCKASLLEVAPEPELRRTSDETHDRLKSEPGRAVCDTLRPKTIGRACP